MKDGTWLPKATTITADQKEACIGIVYVVNPDGITGKIVGLTEATKKWGVIGTGETAIGIDSPTDGATATKNMITTHKDEMDFATVYSAFYWVYNDINGGNINGRWYLPAKEELKALYGNYNGDMNVDVHVKTAVNASLSSVSGATQLASNVCYLSSTQNDNDGAWNVDFFNGSPNSDLKNANASVRVVSAF